jgi:hypothetical protein
MKIIKVLLKVWAMAFLVVSSLYTPDAGAKGAWNTDMPDFGAG